MSSGGKCPRRLYYQAHHYPESNPPDQQSLNIMALGHAAELIMLGNMRQDERWEIKHTAENGQKQLEIHMEDPPLIGHPDGICRHPVHTQGQWTTLECKSMSPGRLEMVEEATIVDVYPEYKAQVTCYAQVLFDMGLVAIPRHAVFVTMDREGHYGGTQLIEWSDQDYQTLMDELRNTWQHIQTNQIPDRPYYIDSKTCGWCPYFTLCHGEQLVRGQQRSQPAQVNDPAIIEAARRYAEAKAVVDEYRAILQEVCQQDERQDIIVEFLQDDRVETLRASYFHPRAELAFNEAELLKHLPADVLDACRITADVKPGFWVRKPRK